MEKSEKHKIRKRRPHFKSSLYPPSNVLLWGYAFSTSKWMFLGAYDQFEMIPIFLRSNVHLVCILLTHSKLDLIHQIFSPNRVDKR